MQDISQWYARDQRLKHRWALLENQRKLHAALDQVLGGWLSGDEDLANRAILLRQRVAREIVLSAEAIWDESANAHGVIGA